MKTSAVKIITAVFLAAVIPAPGALNRPYTDGPQVLSINGAVCPEMVNWSGGDPSAPVTVEGAGSGTTPKKHLGNVVYEPIVMVVSLPLSAVLQNSLSDLCANRSSTLTLLLTNSDGTQLQATNAVLTEARFPALDAGAKDAWRLTLVFSPESTHSVSGSAAASSVPGVRPKGANSGTYRFNLAGLTGNQVSHIEAFTITRASGSTQIPDLSVTTGHTGATDWASWRDDFIVQGNSDDPKEKNGSLEILTTDLQAVVLLPLQLSHVGIKRFALVPGGSDSPDKYRAELYCEGMSVATSPVTSATTPTSTTGAPATTPAPAPATPPAEPAPTDGKTPAKEPAKTPAETAPSESPVPADSKAPAKEGEKTPETAPAGTSPTPAAAPTGNAETKTNPKDKASRDPADFPRADGMLRTQFSVVREKGFVQETANYTSTKTKADGFMAYYEDRLKGGGWEESARYENDNGSDHAHQIISTWKKDIRTASLKFMDATSGTTEIQVVLQSREK